MSLKLVSRARNHGDRLALLAPEGVFSYSDLLTGSEQVATGLLAGRDNLGGARVCFLVPPGWVHTAVQWGIWRAGGIAVPLAASHPTAELEYVLDDADPEVAVAHPALVHRLNSPSVPRSLSILQTPTLLRPSPTVSLPLVDSATPALMLYTSGTTGSPRGVILTHRNIEAQVESLTDAWAWSRHDHILLHLPLHHVHAVVNILTSALWNGATCEVLPRFSPVDVWERLARSEVTLYMAVPTVYRRLIEAWESADSETRNAWTEGARSCRLMVSGSAALPVPTLERWEQITGQRLLERYGMTEIGMGLSNPLIGERRPGFVGAPLPGVQVRLVDEVDREVPPGERGEIQVRGPAVFSEYWQRPVETEGAFTDDAWFRTGDHARVEAGSYKILGRSSVDILKTGGEKISALEIEDVLRAHDGVVDCAVVGVADVDWGERVCAAAVLHKSSNTSVEDLRTFARNRLAPYKVPKDILLLDSLPRNAMGKVTKLAVKHLFTLEGNE